MNAFLKFADTIQICHYRSNYICTMKKPYQRVVISQRLKEIIDAKNWSQARPEDLEEIRSLYELGMLIEDKSC